MPGPPTGTILSSPPTTERRQPNYAEDDRQAVSKRSRRELAAKVPPTATPPRSSTALEREGTDLSARGTTGRNRHLGRTRVTAHERHLSTATRTRTDLPGDAAIAARVPEARAD